MILKYLFLRLFNLNIFLLQIFIITFAYKSFYLIEKNEHFLPKKIFIFSAYRISDDTVRILYLKNVWSKNFNLFYRFQVQHELQKVDSICQRSECPTFHDPFCTLNGYLGIIKIPLFNQHSYLKNIQLFTKTNFPLKTIQIPLMDSRPKNPPNFFLGICLQPIFYLFSPKLLISFFEYWISQDITIFYIYRHSWSSEVEKIFEFYLKHPKIIVKLIDWSDLSPSQNEMENNLNPNKFFRRLEFSFAMADCVYRSRSEIKYLIMTDLDEIIYIKSGKTVKNFIQTQVTQNISAFWFSSAKIIGKSNLTLIWKYLEKPIQSKLIINTQLTKTINIHTPGESEISSKNSIIDIHPNDAVIVHSRFDYENANGSINSNILSMKGLLKLKSDLDFHVKKVYKILKISYNKYEKLQQHIFKDFDECAAAFKGKLFCKSIYSCKNFLNNSEFIESKLIRASNSWRIL